MNGVKNFRLNNRVMKKLILLVCIVFFTLSAHSQSGVVDFLKGGRNGLNDANLLSGAYLSPYAKALGDGLNNGWYNSAKTHNLFGFDLSISVSAIQIPDEAKSFDISQMKFSNFTLANSQNHIAPTVAGKNERGPSMLVNDNNGKSLASFNTPNGLAQDLVPVPVLQIGFGLLPHTDIIGRYIPELKYNNNGDDMKLGFWGIGAKHNFMEWIPVLKKLPFDASVIAAYSQIDGESEFTFYPSNYSGEDVTVTLMNNSQLLKLKTSTGKLGLVVSKKLAILTVFAGIGQNTSKTTIDLIGKYTVTTKVSIGGQIIPMKEEINNPIALEFDSKRIYVDAGLRLKLAFFSLFGSINKSEYTSYNAGLGFSFR
jgi:hypothetical protein